MTESARVASSTVSANTDTQSSVRQAGTTPLVEIMPRLGFRPTILLSSAGIRPEPAVSVPSASGTSPAAPATAEPELDPPGISFGSSGFRRTPYGECTPTRPGAHRSALVLPLTIPQP